MPKASIPIERAREHELFKIVAKFCRNREHCPPLADIEKYACKVGPLALRSGTAEEIDAALKARAVDSVVTWSDIVGPIVANDVYTTFDASKKRKVLSKRDQRQKRDAQIVACYTEAKDPSITKLTETFNVSRHTINTILKLAGIQPRRRANINKLPPAAATMILIMESFAVKSGVSSFGTVDIGRHLTDLFDNICPTLEAAARIINDAQLDCRVYVQGKYTLYARDCKYSFEHAKKVADRIHNPNNYLTLHKIRSTVLIDRDEEAKDGLGFIIYLLRNAVYRSLIFRHVVEYLWLCSFDFDNRERIRMLIARYWDRDDPVIKISRYKNAAVDGCKIKAAANITCGLNSDFPLVTHIVNWVDGSDLLKKLNDSEKTLVDKLRSMHKRINGDPELFNSEELDNLISEGLKDIQPSRLGAPAYLGMFANRQTPEQVTEDNKSKSITENRKEENCATTYVGGDFDDYFDSDREADASAPDEDAWASDEDACEPDDDALTLDEVRDLLDSEIQDELGPSGPRDE